ncbi:MAG: hypothetical protein JF615_10760 [Asticcacaulis sp.]|nr:hypothetical protein [Asticcacaulis sp.]
MAGFAAATVAFVVVNLNTQVFVAKNIWTLAVSVCAIPAIIGLFRLPHDKVFAVFDWLQPFVMSIYLFNVVFIGGAKGVLGKLLPLDSAHMLLFIPVLLAAGLIGPIMLKAFVLKRWKVSDELTS